MMKSENLRPGNAEIETLRFGNGEIEYHVDWKLTKHEAMDVEMLASETLRLGNHETQTLSVGNGEIRVGNGDIRDPEAWEW